MMTQMDMVKLSNSQNAHIAEQKLREYILSPSHPTGKHKAKFLQRAGYKQPEWMILEKDLREQHLTQDAKKSKKNSFGQKFIIKAPLVGPNGVRLMVTSVWIILNDEDFPRFVTLMPGE